MMKRLIVGAVLVSAGILIYRAIPDLRRYMVIRKM
ncbi:DUF6893 family small protein [Planotetraspora thailandica]